MRSSGLGGKTAVVTGASSGIGRGIAVALAEAGARVVLVGRSRERLEETNATAGGGCHTVCVDITAPDAASAIIEDAVLAFGGLNVLVHAAGVFLPKSFEEDTLEDFDIQWRTNVRAPFAITQAALPYLRPAGAVIFVSSIAGLVGFPNSAAYCATKGAVELLSKALTLELARFGVRFNCIAPGNIRTPMNEHLLANPDYERAMLAATPSGRIGEVDDVAGAAVYLASDAARYVSGASLTVDGGWTAG